MSWNSGKFLILFIEVGVNEFGGISELVCTYSFYVLVKDKLSESRKQSKEPRILKTSPLVYPLFLLIPNLINREI